VTVEAEKDFDIRDADEPRLERVARTIKPGVAGNPVKRKIIE
jgi:hypothetical protein